MAKINKVMVGESLVGDGNEVAHIDLLIGPRGSAVESAFCNALTNNKDGFTSLLAVIAPNLPCKPNTVMFNKVTIKGAKQAVQMFGPAQYAVAKAVQDSVADGTIPRPRPTTSLFVSACSFTGKRKATPRSRTITIAPPRRRWNGLSPARRRQPKLPSSAIQ
jgi:formaldehyde-activating enzyme